MRIKVLIIIVCSTIWTVDGFCQGIADTPADTVQGAKLAGTKVANVNSSAVEYAPSISADGKTMVFESNPSGSYKLYESRQDENQVWSQPVSIDSINNYGSEFDLIGGPSISFDGNTLYFFSSFDGGEGAEDIYYSVREKHGWSSPKNMGMPINSREFEGFPSISADGNTLYFVKVKPEGPANEQLREMTAGQTCYSIYKSVKGQNGTWSTPSKLPYPINQDCEKAPRIMADNRTIIFSSNRLGGKGKYDLYQSTLTDAGDWDTPIPLGYANSELNDQFPCISAQGDKMYFINSDDIYQVDIPEKYQQFKNNIIQGYITDGKSGAGLATEIIVRDAFTSDELMVLNNNPNDGRYSIVLAVGKSYNIEFRKEGFTTFSDHYNLIEKQDYNEYEKDVKLYQSATLSLNIYDIDIFEPIQAQIKVKVEGEREIMMQVESSPINGQILLDLPLGKAYEIFIDKKNFQSEYLVFDVSGLMIYPDFEKDVELTPIKKEVAINIADLNNNSKVRSRVRIRNTNRDETIIVDGNQTVALRVGDRYEIEATSDQGYAYNSMILDVTDEEDAPLPVIAMKLQPLVVGTDLTLKEILFESNSDQLAEHSFVELLRVIGLMYSNPSLKVEIAAYTDDRGSARYNRLLSQRRANSVVQFLVENEIEDARFDPVGHGEEDPIAPNDTGEGRSKNRRVVLRILAI